MGDFGSLASRIILNTCLAVLTLVLLEHSILAMEIGQTNPVGHFSSVIIKGKIVSGDGTRFLEFIESEFVKKKRSLSSVFLDSEGGNVSSAHFIAEIIRQIDVAVVVDERTQCKSACFLIFAAAHRRFVRLGAQIAVHSITAPIDNKEVETYDTVSSTLALARWYRDYDVPMSIIGYMVTKVPPDEYVLGIQDLKAMNVSGLDN